MPSHLKKVKKKMSLFVQLRSRTILDGEYNSVFKGRSLDFDDLRNYNYGDDVKDIDWKATARTGQMLIRRYIAIRKHNILIVVNSSRSMSALAPSGETKHQIAVFSAGVISYITQKHGDLIGLISSNKDSIRRFPFRSETSHIEGFLNYYDNSVNLLSPKNSINNAFDYILKNMSEHMIIITITDPESLESVSDNTLRRLNVRHEQLCIIINDSTTANPILKNSNVFEVNSSAIIPNFIRLNPKFQAEESESSKKYLDSLSQRLNKNHIANTIIDSESESIANIIKLLEKKRRARH